MAVRSLRALALCAAWLAAACDDPVRSEPVATVRVAAPWPYVDVGQTLQLTAEVRGASGGELAGKKVAWTSSAPAVATVQDGVVTGKAEGSALITAAVGSVRDTVRVFVERAVGSVRVDGLGGGTLVVGKAARVRVSLYDEGGALIAQHSVRYASSDTAVLRVDTAGVVRAVGPGTGTLTVTAGKGSATATVTVQRAYTLTYLGTLEGGSSRAYGINGLGQVVGTVTLSDTASRAFLWSNGAMTLLGPGQAWDVNDAGLVVGSSRGKAVAWKDGSATLLLPNTGGFGIATAVNRHGHVVVTVRTPFCSTGGRCHGFVYLVRDADTTLVAEGTDAEGWGINDEAWVVGNTGSAHYNTLRPYLWRNGTRTEIGRGVFNFQGLDVNHRGTAVGGGFSVPAVVWEGATETGITTQPHYQAGMATGINDRGEVVGFTGGTDGGMGFLWKNGKLTDLDELHADPDWKVLAARKVNERGQIVGWGRHRTTGRIGALLLTPPS